jgi:lipid-A-disaccharide synthase
VRVFISVGDPSGDQHAAQLIYALREQAPDVQIEGLGGKLMQHAGAEITPAFTDAPIIGFGALIPQLLYYRRLLKSTVRHLVESRTDVLVLVDYPGFNLRLADAAKKAGIKTVYYIGPQIWAWGAGRVKRVKRAVDLMLVVFEFELDLYKEAGVTVRYVGHPLLDQLDFAQATDFRRRQGFDEEALLLGLFPGSRPSEIDRIFPVMLKASERIRAAIGKVQLACAMAPGLARERYEHWLAKTGVQVTLLADLTHPLMQQSDLALVTSGTATLEVALLGTPELVLYRLDPLTAILARLLIRVPLVGLVNVVAQRAVAPELLLKRCNPITVADTALTYLKTKNLKAGFAPVAEELRGKLGQPGAALRAAQAILELAQL